MASLLRSSLNFGCKISRLSHLYRISVKPKIAQPTRSIYTSSKRSDSDKHALTIPDSKKRAKDVPTNLLEKDEYWISHGYDYFDRDSDEWEHHLIMFCFITLPTAWFILYVCYYPQHQGGSWEKREALLEITRREKLGLPLIDANFIDPSKINLPSDEELGDFEIIV